MYLFSLPPLLQPLFPFWISLGELLFKLPLYWAHACLYHSSHSCLLEDSVPAAPTGLSFSRAETCTHLYFSPTAGCCSGTGQVSNVHEINWLCEYRVGRHDRGFLFPDKGLVEPEKRKKLFWREDANGSSFELLGLMEGQISGDVQEGLGKRKVAQRFL